MAEKNNSFDWGVYADATFAGLSVLIPVPLLDMLFETFFRRRMPVTIARRRQISLSKTVLQQLRQGRGCSPAGCIALPLWLTFQFLKRLSRKILYFLTVKEATDMLSVYWHRAFLLDHMVQAGHLADDAPTEVARASLDATLDDVTTSPLNQLAQQVIGNTHHSFRSLWRIVRRRNEDEDISGNRKLMGRQWSEYDDYWLKLASFYDEKYRKLLLDYEQRNAYAAAAADAGARNMDGEE